MLNRFINLRPDRVFFIWEIKMKKYNLNEYENSFVVLDENDRIVSFNKDEKTILSDVERYLSYRESNLKIYKLLDCDKQEFIKAIIK